jgi:hypothetical protein
MDPLSSRDFRLETTFGQMEADPPRRLMIRWQNPHMPEVKAEGESQCTMELEPSGTAVKLYHPHHRRFCRC